MKHKILFLCLALSLALGDELCIEVENDICKKCGEGAELQKNVCACKAGLQKSSKGKFCCPFRCKECTLANKCQTCSEHSTFSSQTNRCECDKDYLNMDFTQNCTSIILHILDANETLVDNFEYKSELKYENKFKFCNSTSIKEDILTDNFDLQIVDNGTNTPQQKIQENMKKIGQNAFATYIALPNITSRAILYQNYLSPQFKTFTRDMNDSFYNISYAQGKELKTNESNWMVGFDIREIESQYHFNLIVNCGEQEKNLNDTEIAQLLDHYFGLFYICPPNCVDCSFSDNGKTIRCSKCSNKFNLTTEGVCKLEDNQGNCENSKQHSFDDKCKTVVNKELLICWEDNQCYNCLDQRKISRMNDKCECDDGYYLDQRKLSCEQCETLCQKCQYRKTYCTECKQDVSYHVKDKKQCLQCKIKNCKTCLTGEKCEKCDYGYYLDKIQTECTECTMKNCKDCKNKNECNKADPGYYIGNQKVQECQTKQCANCGNDNKCKTCIEGYFLKIDQCKPCEKGCKICDENQVCKGACFDNYYPDPLDLQCRPCVENCKSCYKANQCNDCITGLVNDVNKCKCEKDDHYYNKEKKQCEQCPENCAQCDNNQKCNQCKEKYFKSANNKCQQCKGNCKKCDEKTCEQCIEGKIKTDESEDCFCMDGCDYCESLNVCKQSKDGYYLQDQLPVKCEEICSKCESKDTCQGCITGYYLTSENQCAQCSDNCSECNNEGCTQCKNEYYLNEKQCVQCENNCLKCKLEKTKSVCLKCKENLILEKGKCEEGNCLSPIKDGKCDKCKDGFYLATNKCAKCTGENCATCDSDIKCTKCKDQNYYLNAENQCTKCPQYCTACKQEKQELICTDCLPDYSLNSNGKCSKDSNTFSVLIIIGLFAGLYFLYSYRQVILGIFRQDNKYSKNPDDELEMSSSKRKEVQPISKEQFNIFNDD